MSPKDVPNAVHGVLATLGKADTRMLMKEKSPGLKQLKLQFLRLQPSIADQTVMYG
jgi:hypothetical protein